ncbi:MAG: hypothetical protein S4CHLAM45_04370 [Chlamydiales bacterium]|nr:hypothetical protein [Chlamydiales bacterium]MCH9619290.1 hypothetical protein [Chlamydiales bacterium]MCH9622552.1 hypothetical protein [Chlamydiales bacterium]
MNPSPPFQIGEPLNELSQKDFKDIFPQENKLVIAPINKGLSGAKIYKVTGDKNTYLVRYSSGIFGAKEIFSEFAIQKYMALKQLSPKIYYSNPKRGIVAMQFIENTLSAGRDPAILNKIPNSTENLINLIRNVHRCQAIEGKITSRIALDYVKRSSQELPEDFLDKKDRALLNRIVNTPWPKGMCSLVHNDFRSENLLHDGQRFWLVDWELGGLSHPFYDIAYFSNYQTLDNSEGEKLFSLYLERTPTGEELRDFSRLRRIAFGFSATLALPSLAKMGDEIKQQREGEPAFSTLRELWQKIDEGSLDFDVPRDEYRISLFLLRSSENY